jgi:alpha-glucoside transport system substrate-binding protein
MTQRRFLTFAAATAIAASACANPPAATKSAAPATQPPASTSAQPSVSPSAATGNELSRAKAGEFKGKTVDVFGQWIDADGKAFDESIKAFRDATGINVIYSGISNYETVLSVRVEGGLAPDIAQIAQAGTMRTYQAEGKLVALDDVLDAGQLKKDYSPGFIDAGSVGGKIYGLFYDQNFKSIVWYPVKAFADKGYAVPKSYADLQALEQRIVADGGHPWCTTIEHGDVSGWVATDWIEDVLLRTAPVETYDKWMTHQIPFNDPAVINAANIVKGMWFTPNYTYGGSTRINATWVGDSQTPMFDKGGPKCWLHKQAAWIPDFWPKDANKQPLYKPGVDSSFFYFPAIDSQYGNPVLGASDMLVMFNDRPEVRALMQWFATPDSVLSRVETGGFLAANNAVPQEAYKVYPMSGLAEIARTATVLRPDASDAMPKAIGGSKGAFLTGMVDWVAHNGENTDQVFQKIEAAWPAG